MGAWNKVVDGGEEEVVGDNKEETSKGIVLEMVLPTIRWHPYPLG